MKSLIVVLPILGCCVAALAQPAVDRVVSPSQSGTPQFRRKIPGGAGTLLRDPGTQQVPELFPGEIEDVGPQFLIARPEAAQPEHHWVDGFFDMQLFYTSNALLTEKARQDTSVMVLTLQAAINLPPFEFLGGTMAPRAGYRHQWWMYSLDDTSNQLNNFDFAIGSVFAGFRHTWGDRWVATVSLDYNRYLAHEDEWAEFYTEFVPNWSLEYNIPIGDEGKAQLTLGYYGAYHFTHTDPSPVEHINDRLDNAIGFVYTRELFPKLYIQPYYRLQWSHYTENSDRNDVYNNAGIGVLYAFTDWAAIRAFVSFENRNSTDDTVADYNKWDTGGGVTISVGF